jgi:hypothetical protein
MESQNFTYSSEEDLRRIASEQGYILPSQVAVADPKTDLEEETRADEAPSEELDGEAVAGMIARFGAEGHRPTFKQALIYREHMKTKEVDMWNGITSAMSATASDLGSGAYELIGDALHLKVPKVVGSVIEGAIMGTANWYHMYEEGKFNEDSLLHKMLFKKNNSDEEYYSNLMNMLDLRQSIEEHTRNGYFLPKEIEVGGHKVELWNPAVVMAISYVADPSWVAPNFGIESALAKGMNSANRMLKLNEQLASAGIWASKSIEGNAKKVGESAGRLSAGILKVEESLLKDLKDTFEIDAFIGTSGQVVDKSDLGRGAMTAVGMNAVKIPAWSVTTLTWGVAKLGEGLAGAVETGARIAREAPKNAGMRLSERIAMESESKVVSAMANTWAKTGSPFLEWGTATAHTTLHAGMYGGAFGFTFGGEEGFYNGIGSGFVLGGAFHQIGAFHNTVAGGNSPNEVIKNFLWSTQHYDLANQQGLHRLLTNVERDYNDGKGGGEKAKLEVMSDIASAERLQRNVRRLILTEQEIQARMTDAEWVDYEKFKLAQADTWGGVAFRQKLSGEMVTIINADRAVKSAVKEELFHTLMMSERYREVFHQDAMQALIGTDDHKGALYRMPKEQALKLLKQFKESYVGLEQETAKKAPVNDGHFQELDKHWDEVINDFREGKDLGGKMHSLFEEFLASYWNRFIEDKPIDYLLKGGDLGLIRNAVQLAKDSYQNIMHTDLTSAGAHFNFGTNIDHFFLDQKTGQRVRIPKLEKLMEHFVKTASKEMYTGWTINPRKGGGIEGAVVNELEHLWSKDATGGLKRTSESDLDKETAVSMQNVLRSILELDKSQRGLKITVNGNNGGDGPMAFSRGKPKKPKTKKQLEEEVTGTKPVQNKLPNRRAIADHWDEVEPATPRKKRKTIDEDEIATAEEVAGEDTSGSGRWSTDKRKKFWESVWEGNPRITITGRASTAELKILSDHLPANTVKRFAELNTIIEMAREGVFAKNVSNIAKTEYMAKQKENNDGSRITYEAGEERVRHTNFIPVELHLYFERNKRMVDGEPEMSVGTAQIKVTAIDHDALIKRVDYAWAKWVETGMSWRTVRKLFGDKTNLYQACKDLITHYSNSESKEGGIRIFQANGAVGARDAGHMRTIANAVLGFHPTNEMVRRGEHSNPRWKLQNRMEGKKVEVPDVIFDMNIRRMGRITTRNGEGFGVDWNSAYVRSQYNHSPAKVKRDHEGNPLRTHELSALQNSVYRNKDGEVLAVYSLNKPYSSQKRKSESSVFDYVDEGLGNRFGSRGGEYFSDTGWLHYTPDMGLASLVSKGSMKTGYIDTQKHIDLSDLHPTSTVEDVAGVLVNRMSELTGKSRESLLAELLSIETGEGVTVGELFNTHENVLMHEGHDLDVWLFTPETVKFMNENGINSVEYQYHNRIADTNSTAVALLDNRRFIENVSRRAEANYFAFSPAKKPRTATHNPPKTITEVLQDKIRALQKGNYTEADIQKAFLSHIVSEDGNTVLQNPERLTEEGLDSLIQEQLAKVKQLTKKEQAEKFGPADRAKIASQLRSHTIKALREKFPVAPTEVLNQIADVALSGVSVNAKTVTTGRVAGRDIQKEVLEINGTVLGRIKKKGGLTGRKIEDSGIPMLAHIAEMSERDFQIFKAIPEYLDAIKKGTTAEWLQTNQSIVDDLYGKHGGPKKFYKKFDDAQKDIFFLLDAQLANKIPLTDGSLMDIVNEKKLKEAFAEKTRAFVFKTLTEAGWGQRGSLMESWDKYRDVKKEAEMSRALFRMHSEKIEGMLTSEFHERVLDTLTALDIPLDNKVVNHREIAEMVRAVLYDQSRKGLIKLGSYEAIAESVRLYYEYAERESVDGKKIVIDKKKVIRENLVKALIELEESGFEGINWTKRQDSLEKTKEGKVYKQTQKLFAGSGDTLMTIDAHNIWDFEGTHFKVIEEGVWADDSALILRDMRTGEAILTKPMKKEGSSTASNSERQRIIREFLSEATHSIVKRQPATALSMNFGQVHGPVKEYVITKWLADDKQANVGMLGGQDFSNFALYKQGNHYVAVRKYENYLIDEALPKRDGETDRKRGRGDIDTQQRIDQLERDFANGVVERTVPSGKNKTSIVKRKGSADELATLREQITDLKGKLFTDRGVILEMGQDGSVTVIDTPHTMLEMATAIKNLKKGNLNTKSFDAYVKEMYRTFHYKLKAFKEKEAGRIDKVLDPKEGNLVKIKKLQAEIDKHQSEVRNLYMERYRKLRKERYADGKEAYPEEMWSPSDMVKEVEKQIDADIKNADQNVRNAQNRIYALEQKLLDLGAFPEFSKMSMSEQQTWLAQQDRYSKENGVGGKYDTANWLDTKMPMLQGEPTMDYIVRIRKERQAQSQLLIQHQGAYDGMKNLLDYNKLNLEKVKLKVQFLAQQYAEASGIKVTQGWLKGLVDGGKDEMWTSVINMGKIKNLTGGKAMTPRYLPDTEGVVGKKSSAVTVKDMHTAFLEGMMTASDNWRGITGSRLERINLLLDRAEKQADKGPKEPRPVRPEGMKDAEWTLTQEYYLAKKHAREFGATHTLPLFKEWVKMNAEKFPKLAVEVIGKKGEETTNIRSQLRVHQRPQDVNLNVEAMLRDVSAERGLMFEDIMEAGRQKARPSTEFNLGDDLNTVLEGSSLNHAEGAWVQDPINRKKVEELQQRWKEDRQDDRLKADNKFVEAVKEEHFRSVVGKDGREILDSIDRIESLQTQAYKLYRIVDELEFQQHQLSITGDKDGEIPNLKAKQTAYEERIYKLNSEIKPLEVRIQQTIDITAVKEKQDAVARMSEPLRRIEENITSLRAEFDARNLLIQKLNPPAVPVPEGGPAGSRAQIERATALAQNAKRPTRAQYEEIKTAKQEMAEIQKEIHAEEAKAIPLRKAIKDTGVEAGEWKYPKGSVETDISPVQIAKFNNPAYQMVIDMVNKKRQNIDAYLLQRERTLNERKQLAESHATDYAKHLATFDARAKQLGYSSSSLIVSPNNPRTHQIYLAFPKISYDLYGSMHPLDWSGSEWQIGTTARGEKTISFGSSNDPAYVLYNKEVQGGRKIYTLADYMFFAQKKAEYHIANPDMPISAEDAMLIRTLVPPDVYVIPKNKADTIIDSHWREIKRIKSGILDNLDVPSNAKALVTRFVEDGLDLVIGRRQDRINAFKRLEGLSDAEFLDRTKDMTPEQVDQMTFKKEYIEQAYYWLQDAKDVGGFIYLTENTATYEKQDPKNKNSTKPFLTEKLSIQSIIEMDGFLAQLQESMDRRKISSMFDTKPYSKTLYEALPIQERVNLDATVVQKLALENDAGVLRHQGLLEAERRGNPQWFPDQQKDIQYTGNDADSIRLEHERVESLLKKVGAVEASVAMYKGEVTNFISKRPWALDHLLSLKDDGVHFSNLVWKDGDVTTRADSMRTSNDGRYIIKREPYGKDFRYQLYYIGETFLGADGVKIYEIPTSQLGTFSDTTQAQVMARFIEDDIVRLRTLQSLVKGGNDNYSPTKVFNTLIPFSSTKAGHILGSLAEVPAFSGAVIRAYEAHGGKPEHASTMKKILSPLQDFGELQYFAVNGNGQVVLKTRIITPSVEGTLKKYFDLSYTADGHKTWTSKDRTQTSPAPANTEHTAPTASNPALETPTVHEQKLADITSFEAISNVQVEGQNFQQWEVIRNKLNYQIIRTKVNGTQQFKLFNQSSLFIGQFHHEQEAVDEIFAKEFAEKGLKYVR